MPEPDTGTEESKSILKGIETVGASLEHQRRPSAKVQSQDATTAHFAREGNLAPSPEAQASNPRPHNSTDFEAGANRVVAGSDALLPATSAA